MIELLGFTFGALVGHLYVMVKLLKNERLYQQERDKRMLEALDEALAEARRIRAKQ